MPKSRYPKKKSSGLLELVWLFVVAIAVAAYALPRAKVLLMSPEERAKIELSVTYSGCDEVRALGRDPIYAGQPGYRSTMDGDGDGAACEPYP